MNSNSPENEPISDETLLEMRRAYHLLEAFQLSPEHRNAKQALKSLLEQQTDKNSPE